MQGRGPVRAILVCAALLASTVVAAAPKSDTIAAYHALAAQDLRLATVGYRLADANVDFCRNKARIPGWVLHDERQYPDLAAARAAFAFRQPVSISALVPGGPAEKAGMELGDGPVYIGGDTMIWYGGEPVHHRPTVERLENIKKTIATALSAKPPLSITITTQTGDRKFALDPPPICATEFWVDPKAKTDAGADGDRVRVTSGLLDFVADDDELAAVIAHELAHNLLGHPEKLSAIRKGKSKAIRETENEADLLSVWLMANAGYDPKASVRFWQRYGPMKGGGLFTSATHLPWKKRVSLLSAEIDTMNAQPEIKGKRRPPLLSSAP